MYDEHTEMARNCNVINDHQALSRKMDAYWRAANYLSVGQIYLLRQPALARAARSSSTSSRGSWATGARRRARTSSTSI